MSELTQKEINFLKLQNEINVKFEDYLQKYEKRLLDKDFRIAGLENEFVCKRLTQIFVKENFHSFNHSLSSNKVFIEKSVHFFKYYILFCGYLFKLYFLGSFKILIPNKRSFGQTTTIFEVHGFDQLFKEQLVLDKNFFSDGPISFFRDSDHILISSLKKQKSPKSSFVKNPWLELTSSDRLCFLDWFEWTILNLRTFFSFSIKLLHKPHLTVLYRDLGFFPLIHFVNNHGLVNYFAFTNTGADDQNVCISSLLGKKFTTHFVEYSVNSKPMKFTFHEGERFAELPFYRNILVDEAWVWNQDQAVWLKKFNPKIKTHIVGPILFYLPTLKAKSERRKKLITFFDVTPFTNEHIQINLGLHGYNYYNTENAIKLLNDLVSEFYNYKIQIKPKRSYVSLHDQRYINTIIDFKKLGRVDVLDPFVNIYEVICNSDFIITTPYSSPALIAPELNKKAIYYDPTGFLVCNYNLPNGVYYCSGPLELKKLIKKLSL
jgi:polysaccharide biosynthesis PFTS motif protein